jgi:Transposase DDE domain group 1
VHQRRPPKTIVLDMDSSESPAFGEQEGSAYNGHFGCTCYHPLFVFNQLGDVERCALRAGNATARCPPSVPASLRGADYCRRRLSQPGEDDDPDQHAHRLQGDAGRGALNPRSLSKVAVNPVAVVFWTGLAAVSICGRRLLVGHPNRLFAGNAYAVLKA